jgi:hypothetical protein
MSCQSWPDRFGFMDLVVIYDNIDTLDLVRRVRAIQQGQ